MDSTPDITPVEYIQYVMRADGLTVNDICERASDNGHGLSPNYVHSILTGKVDTEKVGIKIVKALAAGLGKTESELLVVFGFRAE